MIRCFSVFEFENHGLSKAFNHGVPGSSPGGGQNKKPQILILAAFFIDNSICVDIKS
jgi:hypothetical protein